MTECFCYVAFRPVAVKLALVRATIRSECRNEFEDLSPYPPLSRLRCLQNHGKAL